MNTPPPSAQRKVSLRLASATHEVKPLPAESLETLLARARALGIPLHRDPQIAALLASLRLRDDVPAMLYAAAAGVLATIYHASEE